MKLKALHKSVGFEDCLNELMNIRTPVSNDSGTCIFIDISESCESRYYIDGFGAYSIEDAVLRDGECMSCWDVPNLHIRKKIDLNNR